MTRVNITDIDKHIYITARDHATGSKEVCAAVSALMYMFEGYLRNEEPKVKNHKSEFRDGYATIEFDAIRFDVYHALECFVIGLLQIEGSYPDYLKVDIDRGIAHLINVLGVNPKN